MSVLIHAIVVYQFDSNVEKRRTKFRRIKRINYSRFASVPLSRNTIITQKVDELYFFACPLFDNKWKNYMFYELNGQINTTLCGAAVSFIVICRLQFIHAFIHSYKLTLKHGQWIDKNDTARPISSIAKFPNDELHSAIVLCGADANVFEMRTWKRIILSTDLHSTQNDRFEKWSHRHRAATASNAHTHKIKTKSSIDQPNKPLLMLFSACVRALIGLGLIKFEDSPEWKMTGLICHFILRLLRFLSLSDCRPFGIYLWFIAKF